MGHLCIEWILKLIGSEYQHWLVKIKLKWDIFVLSDVFIMFEKSSERVWSRAMWQTGISHSGVVLSVGPPRRYEDNLLFLSSLHFYLRFSMIQTFLVITTAAGELVVQGGWLETWVDCEVQFLVSDVINWKLWLWEADNSKYMKLFFAFQITPDAKIWDSISLQTMNLDWGRVPRCHPGPEGWPPMQFRTEGPMQAGLRRGHLGLKGGEKT